MLLSLLTSYLAHPSPAVCSAPRGRGCRDRGNRGHPRRKISSEGTAGMERELIVLVSLITPRNLSYMAFIMDNRCPLKEELGVNCKPLPHLLVSLAIRVSVVGNVPTHAALGLFHDVIVVTVVLEPQLPIAVDAVGTPLETWAPLAL